MTSFSAEVTVDHGRLVKLDRRGRPSSDPADIAEVQFNPASLQVTLTNTFKQDNKTVQFVEKASAKLTMDLVFDTTDTLFDVRNKTRLVAGLAERDRRNAVPMVRFEWGMFTFKGVIESYRETIDYFSPLGIPLRATVNLTMSHQDLVFQTEEERRAAFSGVRGRAQSRPGKGVGEIIEGSDEPIEVPSPPAGSGVTDTQQGADANGTPDSGRELAAANGFESMRFPQGPIVVDPSISLGPPTAFAAGGAALAAGASGAAGAGLTAGASAGFGAAAGISAGGLAGASAGFGAGASFGGSAGAMAGGFGAASTGGFAGGSAAIAAGAFAGGSAGAVAGASAGGFAGTSAGGFGGSPAGAFAGASAGGFASAAASASAFAGSAATIGVGEAPAVGGRVSAGIPASLGAFAGLRAPLPRPRPVYDPSLLTPPRPTARVDVSFAASFGIGGQAVASAGVNGRTVWTDHISFDDE